MSWENILKTKTMLEFYPSGKAWAWFQDGMKIGNLYKTREEAKTGNFRPDFHPNNKLIEVDVMNEFPYWKDPSGEMVSEGERNRRMMDEAQRQTGNR